MGLCRWAYSEMGSYSEHKNSHRFAMCFQVETSTIVRSNTFKNFFRNYKFKFNINFQSHISVFISQRENGKCKIKIKKETYRFSGNTNRSSGSSLSGCTRRSIRTTITRESAFTLEKWKKKERKIIFLSKTTNIKCS